MSFEPRSQMETGVATTATFVDRFCGVAFSPPTPISRKDLLSLWIPPVWEEVEEEKQERAGSRIWGTNWALLDRIIQVHRVNSASSTLRYWELSTLK